MTHRDTASSPPPPLDTPLQRFGALLRQYRQQRGLSQKALTARTGIPSTYISEIEQGLRNIAVLALLCLAHALDIPAAWLLVGLDPSATLDRHIISCRSTRQGCPVSRRGPHPSPRIIAGREADRA